jgi:lysozyme
MTPTNIYEQLERDEALRLRVYPDSRGFRTIGVGHNLDANPLPFDVSNGITASQALQVLHDDVSHVTAQLLRDVPLLGKLDLVRFGVFQNMAFNMGEGGVLLFHHDIADTLAGNYITAAQDMRDSKWYTQVGARAERLCKQMEKGIWQ